MAVLDAFVWGAVAGGVGALAVFLVVARTAKGRSTTAFALTGGTATQVLQAAAMYFQQRGMHVAARADGIAGEEGSEWISGVRVLEVRARDRDGGVGVWIEAYIRGFYPKEIQIDPNSWFGMLPRRKAFGLAQGLAAALGAPGAAWEHRHA